MGVFVFAAVVWMALLGLAGCDTAPEAAQPQVFAPISEPTQLDAATPVDFKSLTGAEPHPVDAVTLASEEPRVYKRTLVYKKSLTETQHQVLVKQPQPFISSVPAVYEVPVLDNPNINPSMTVPSLPYNPTTIRTTTALDTMYLRQLEMQIQSQQVRMAYAYNPIYDLNSPVYHYNLSSDLWTSYGTPNTLSSFYSPQINPITIQPITIQPITIQPITPIQIVPITIQPITPIFINPITTWP